MFFDELDLLEIRLNVLAEKVDHFVIVEGTTTHSGQRKPLHFEENKARFVKFLPQIIHVKVADIPHISSTDRWPAEYYQRNAILMGLEDAKDDDFIVVSDVDEIWNPEKWPENASGEPFAFCVEIRSFYLNSIILKYNAACVGASLSAARTLTPQRMRDTRHIIPALPAHEPVPGVRFGGWHFGWLRHSREAIQKKISAFAHAELDNPNGVDMWMRAFKEVQLVNPLTDTSLPEYLLKNLALYSHLMRWP